MTKRRIIPFVSVLVALVSELLPRGAVCNFADGEGEIIRKTFSYFSLVPYGYANFGPLITATLTLVLVIFCALALVMGDGVLKRTRKSICLIAVITSVAPLMQGLSSYSAIGGIISASLLCCLLSQIFMNKRKVGPMKLNEINIRDPFIVPHEGKYYMYGTRGEGCWAPCKVPGMGFDVYVSDDLETWSSPKAVFEASKSFWATHNFWAPEVHKYEGRFYMFASFIAKNKMRGTQILVSDTPDGEFKPLTDSPITPEDWMCLDGTLYVDKKGEPHIVFCHEHVQISDGTVCEMQLSRDLKTAVTGPRTLFKGSDPYWARKNHHQYVTDGPFMYRGESGRLYMIWSSFNESGYVQATCCSDNGDIDGNFIHDLPLIAEKDGGHGMIFRGFDGKDYLVLHRPNNNPMERPVLTEIYEEDGALKLR